jgi:N-acetylglutamate synthase-like GNAT family acetyltransferase
VVFVFFRKSKREDIADIIALAEKETGQVLNAGRVLHDLEKYPHEIAEDEEGLLGFLLSEEICPDILLVHTIVVRNEKRCDNTGRFLLELTESKATALGYRALMVSGFAQKALLGCDEDIILFAGYKTVYDTGGSRLILKRLD